MMIHDCTQLHLIMDKQRIVQVVERMDCRSSVLQFPSPLLDSEYDDGDENGESVGPNQRNRPLFLRAMSSTINRHFSDSTGYQQSLSNLSNFTRLTCCQVIVPTEIHPARSSKSRVF